MSPPINVTPRPLTLTHRTSISTLTYTRLGAEWADRVGRTKLTEEEKASLVEEHKEMSFDALVVVE